MRRRRGWRRGLRVWGHRLTKVAATMAIGAMLGFLVPTFIADYAPKPDVPARVAESPVARAFIDAYVRNDTATLDSLGAATADKLQAARMPATFVQVGAPVHLGSWVGGGFTLHAYAAPTVAKDGTVGLRSWRVITASGNVAIIDPPSDQQKP